MFEKARVESIFYTSQGNKKDQFKNWNQKEHDRIVNTLHLSLDEMEEYENYNINQLNIIKEKTVSRFFNRIPDNSLIVSLINTNNTAYGSYSLCYPFFSSHIMLPVKPGEVVWVFKYHDEKNEKQGKIKNYQREPYVDKCYWISRVHGESFSEDLNYTHHDRSFMPTILTDAFSNFKMPTFNDQEYSSNSSSNSNVTELILDKNKKLYKNFFIDAVSRTPKLPGDILIQGSNNNSIKMSANKDSAGNICIVAGKGKIIERRFQNKKLDRISATEISKYPSSTHLPNIIKNNLGYYENLKYPDFYDENLLSNTQYIENPLEGENDYVNDSSFINLYEKTGKLDYNSIYNFNLKQVQGKISKNKTSKKELQVTEKAKKFIVQNFQSENYKELYDLPSIVAKSNNITIIARKEEEKFRSGKICLVKDSNNYKDYGHIIIDRDGQIGIDGSKIVIGTLKRDTSLKNGEGDLIQLGHSDEMEPLVKGKHLVASLEHLIFNIQEAFTLISSGIKDLSTHTHPHPFGPTSPPVNITNNLENIDTKINSASEIQEEMNKISKNLENILSKLVRTS